MSKGDLKPYFQLLECFCFFFVVVLFWQCGLQNRTACDKTCSVGSMTIVCANSDSHDDLQRTLSHVFLLPFVPRRFDVNDLKKEREKESARDCQRGGARDGGGKSVRLEPSCFSRANSCLLPRTKQISDD